MTLEIHVNYQIVISELLATGRRQLYCSHCYSETIDSIVEPNILLPTYKWRLVSNHGQVTKCLVKTQR